MRKIMLLVSILGLLAYGSTAIALTPYQECLINCPTKIQTVSECMLTDSAFWNINTNIDNVRKGCEAYVNSQRVNCKLDCYIEYNRSGNPKRERAIDFYDRAVKNFPNERVD